MKVKVKCDICNNISTFDMKTFNQIDTEEGFKHVHLGMGLITIENNKYAQFGCTKCSCPISFRLALHTIKNGGHTIEEWKNKMKESANTKPKKRTFKNDNRKR